MALSKTLNYQPFQETNIGFGSNEIATSYSTEFPNSTDIVEVVIKHTGGHFDETGHISTQTFGTVSPFISKVTDYGNEEWVARGQRDDIDKVLESLIFFPADYPQSRPYNENDNLVGWRNDDPEYVYKNNVTDGVFTNEDPPNIPSTVFSITVYNASHDVVGTDFLFCQPDQPTIENQRPYFSEVWDGSLPNVSTSGPGTAVGFGTIANGTDQEHVTCRLETYRWNFFNIENFPRTGLIEAKGYNESYVSDKLPEDADNLDSNVVFEITGELQEVQSYMDNIKVISPALQSHIAKVSIFDGNIGSYAYVPVWYPQDLILSSWPLGTSVSYPDTLSTEEVPLQFSANGYFFDTSDMSEITSLAFTSNWKMRLTFPLGTWSDKILNAYISNIGITPTIDATGEWLEFTAQDQFTLRDLYESLSFDLFPDYNGTFTYDIDVEVFTSFDNFGYPPEVGSTYSYRQESAEITITDQPEWLFTPQPALSGFEQNQIITVGDTGLTVVDNALGGTAIYKLTTRLQHWVNDANPSPVLGTTKIDGVLGYDMDVSVPYTAILSTSPLSYTQDSHDYEFTDYCWEGTKAEIQEVLDNLILIPQVDYLQEDDVHLGNKQMWLEFDLERITHPAGLLEFGQSPILFINEITTVDKYEYTSTYPNFADMSWYKNSMLVWDSGLRITDNAYDGTNPYNGSSLYTIAIEPRIYLNSLPAINVPGEFSSLNLTNITTTYTSTGTDRDNLEIYEFSGTLADLNIMLSRMTFTPDANWFTDPNNQFDHITLDFRISRNVDNIDIVEISDSIRDLLPFGIDLDPLVAPENMYIIEYADTYTGITNDFNTTFDKQFTLANELKQVALPTDPVSYFVPTWNYQLSLNLQTPELIPWALSTPVGTTDPSGTNFSVSTNNPTLFDSLLDNHWIVGDLSNPTQPEIMSWVMSRNGNTIETGNINVLEVFSTDSLQIENRDFGYVYSDPNSLHGPFEEYFVGVDRTLGSDNYDETHLTYAASDSTFDSVVDDSLTFNNFSIVGSSTYGGTNDIISNDPTSANQYFVASADTNENRFVLRPRNQAEIPTGDPLDDYNGIDRKGYWEELTLNFDYEFSDGTIHNVSKIDQRYVTKATEFDRTFDNQPTLGNGNYIGVRAGINKASSDHYRQNFLFDPNNPNSVDTIHTAYEHPSSNVTAYNFGFLKSGKKPLISDNQNYSSSHPAGVWPTNNSSVWQTKVVPSAQTVRSCDLGIAATGINASSWLENPPMTGHGAVDSDEDNLLVLYPQPYATSPDGYLYQSVPVITPANSITVSIGGNKVRWRSDPKSVAALYVDETNNWAWCVVYDNDTGIYTNSTNPPNPDDRGAEKYMIIKVKLDNASTLADSEQQQHFSSPTNKERYYEFPASDEVAGQFPGGAEIGKLPNGNIFVAITERTLDRVAVFQYDSADGYGTGHPSWSPQRMPVPLRVDYITRPSWRTEVNWGDDSIYFCCYIADDSHGNTIRRANTLGWLQIGRWLYYWNGTTWEEKYENLYFDDSNVMCDPTLGYSVYLSNDGKFWRLGHPNGSPDIMYDTGITLDQSVPDVVYDDNVSKDWHGSDASPRDNAFVVGSRIYRFGK